MPELTKEQLQVLRISAPTPTKASQVVIDLIPPEVGQWWLHEEDEYGFNVLLHTSGFVIPEDVRSAMMDAVYRLAISPGFNLHFRDDMQEDGYANV